MALAGVVAAVDFSAIGKALGQRGAAGAGVPDLVAIMGGDPDKMLQRMLSEYGGISKFVKKGDKVVVKPNIGWDRAPELAANTNPVMVKELVRQCRAAGASEVVVFDHTCDDWVKCYDNSGIRKAVEDAGGKMAPAGDESYYTEVKLPKGVKLKSAKIHKAIVDCDVWFNVPVMKHHGGAKMSLSMKNSMGIVWDRKIFHSTDLQQCIADLATYPKKPALNIIDGYRAMLQNGPKGKGPDDVAMLKVLIASVDPVAADTAAVKFFNQAKKMDLSTVGHIAKASELGLGTMDIEGLDVRRIKM